MRLFIAVSSPANGTVALLGYDWTLEVETRLAAA